MEILATLKPIHSNVIFKFKCKAKVTTKSGDTFENKPTLFDAKGKPMSNVNVWGGSEIKVSAELIPYFTSMGGAGGSMRLRAAQIINLIEGRKISKTTITLSWKNNPGNLLFYYWYRIPGALLLHQSNGTCKFHTLHSLALHLSQAIPSCKAWQNASLKCTSYKRVASATV